MEISEPHEPKPDPRKAVQESADKAKLRRALLALEVGQAVTITQDADFTGVNFYQSLVHRAKFIARKAEMRCAFSVIAISPTEVQITRSK